MAPRRSHHGVLVTVTSAAEQESKRVFIVQSYEKGHVCGGPQAEGILKGLAAEGWVDGRNLTVQQYFMDTYRTNTTPEAMRQQGEMGLRHIEAFQPQVVIVLDDPAARYVMLPLIGHPNIAIVFSAMNAELESYNESKPFMTSRRQPGGNVTGIYEKLVVQSLRVMAAAVPRLRSGKVVMITDYSPTGNGLTQQFENELREVVDQRWKVSSAAVNFGSMGTLAGRQAGKILNGTKAGDLPIEDAPDYAIVFNLKRAKDLGISIPSAVLTAADVVSKDDLQPLTTHVLLYDPNTPEPTPLAR